MKVHVIVAGSREFDDYSLLERELNKTLAGLMKEDVTIITGAARGADKLGSAYALDNDYRLEEFPSDWNAYGRSAGMIRNNEMAKYADSNADKVMLVAFWNGRSSGTRNMIETARRKNFDVKVVPFI